VKKIFFVFIIIFIFSSSAFAGEIYTYTDKDGNTVISNTAIPEKDQNKAKKIEAYERDSQAEIAAFQRKQKAAEEAGFRGWQRSQDNGAPTKSAQAANDEQNELQHKRQEKIDKTDKLQKEYWAEVERCKRNKCKISKNLSDEYHKAVEEDPRTITSVTTIRRSRK